MARRQNTQRYPPLLAEHKMTAAVPHPVSTTVPVSSAMEVVKQVLREGSTRTERSAGHNKKGSRQRCGKLGDHHPTLPQENRLDPSAPLPIVTENELNKGLYSCISRGLIPATFDVTAAMGGESGDQPLASEPLALQPYADQFARRELLTTEFGLAPMCNLKLDIQQVLNPPSPDAPLQQTEEIEKEEGKATPQPEPQDHLGAKDRDETRTYTELLDMYSLHEFVIRKGATLDTTPEWHSFHRSHQPMWGAISGIVQQLEKLLTEFNIPLAYIDGKAVAKLATVGLGVYSQEELLACISNREEVSSLLTVPGQRFQHGEAGICTAAVKLQSTFRMFLQKLKFKDLRESHFAAMLIQSHWQIHQQHMVTRSKITSLQQHEERAWRKSMDTFVSNWGKIKMSPRMVIHLPSLSYTPYQCESTPYFNAVQSQLPRLIDLLDPNVEVIYVSPNPVDSEAIQYYTRLLQLSGVNDANQRLHIITPENQSRLPEHLSLTKALLFSQRNLKRLAALVKGRTAYIIPGVVGKEELQLAGKLGLPLLGPDPSVSQHFASKSGAKRIFELADVVTPIGAYDMFEEAELLVVLSKFISDYPEYQKWLIKIDNESNGRGIAVVDVRRLRALEEHEDRQNITGLREKIYIELKDYLGKRVKIVNQNVYPDWAAYMQAFNEFGGIVEAVPADCVSSPVANIYIHPDGSVQVLSVQEQLLAPQYCGLGVIFPQTTVPHAAIRDASLSIGCVCYQKKIIGYASVEFVVFRRNGQPRLWAVDLELCLTNSSIAHRLFQFATCSRMDSETGMALSPEGEPLSYAYSGLIYHPHIGSIRHSVFFKRCKLKGLAFDTVERTGSLFHLVDSMLRGCLGVVCIAGNEDDAIRMFSEAMDFMQQQLSHSAEANDSNFFHAAAAARSLFQKVIAQRRLGAKKLQQHEA